MQRLHSVPISTWGLWWQTNLRDMPSAQELLPLLQPDQPGGVRVLSLHGMGGIGKTTLARELFNRLSGGGLHFSGHHFLEVGQDANLQGKQAQLLEMLAGGPLHAAGSAAQAQQQLQRCTEEAGPLLLALDDIWSAPQRDALLCLDALPEGSRVILTGRDGSALHPDGGCCAARPVEALALEQAERLLCRHAFAADVAPRRYGAAVRRALAVCGGLPLALQVVGAGMRSRSPEAAEVGLCKALKSHRHALRLATVLWLHISMTVFKCRGEQEDASYLLAEADSSTGRQDAAGYSLDVLTLLKWSFDRLPSDDHK
jgi:NB-ARC domain